MNIEGALRLAREGSLYPSLILHGGDDEVRRASALELARTLLCPAAAEERPCGACRHCRRVVWPGGEEGLFHPDFLVLERDLRTVTSVDATRGWLRTAQVSPYEARGQTFVVASAETLSGEAANALLKALEEPHPGAPRHFLLLAPSQFDLLATLRSRSLSIYLGAAVEADDEVVAALAGQVAAGAAAFADSGAAVYLLAVAAALEQAGDWSDPRSARPWSLAARAVRASLDDAPPALRGPLLGLAEDLLAGGRLRQRNITARRILDGLVSRHLGGGPGARPPLG